MNKSNFYKPINLILTFFGLLTFYFVLSCLVQRHYYMNVAYEGIITEKYLDSNRRNETRIVVRNNENHYDNYDIHNYYYYTLMMPGDFIIKKKGALQYILVRNIDTTIFYQNYF